MSESKYIALSTQSVGVGPGVSHTPDRQLRFEPNRPLPSPLVARSETSRLDIHARVSLRIALPFTSIQLSHHSVAISHRRVAIVDYRGGTVLDCFVKPTLPVSDYRTNVTGILPEHLQPGKCRIPTLPGATSLTPSVFQRSTDHVPTFDATQQLVASLIADKIIVGHSLWNDLSGALSSFLSCRLFRISLQLILLPLFNLLCLVLGLPHLAVATRDVALYRPFRKTLRSSHVIGLQTLMWHFMKREVQKQHVVPVSGHIPSSNLSHLRSVRTDSLWPFLHSVAGKRPRCRGPVPIHGDRMRGSGCG